MVERTKRQQLLEERVPPESDPIWKAHAELLTTFLTEPRSWMSLEKWAKEQRWTKAMLLNSVAWMENHWLIHSLDKGPRIRRVQWVLGCKPTLPRQDPLL